MARNMSGQRYLGNTDNDEVHDVPQEDSIKQTCQLPGSNGMAGDQFTVSPKVLTDRSSVGQVV